MSKDKNTPVVAKRALASVATTGRNGRFSAPRKAQAVMRLLRGEDLELLSRELGVVASTLSLWREQFLTAGQTQPSKARRVSLMFVTNRSTGSRRRSVS
jgi:transposase-like protein